MMELQRARYALRGRARKEKKLTWKSLRRQLLDETEHRQYGLKEFKAANRVQNVNAALLEHGTDSKKAARDFARQNYMFGLSTLQHLAQFEPLAFRSLVEVAASRIPPPPPPNVDQQVGLTSPDAELKKDVDRLLKSNSALYTEKDKLTVKFQRPKSEAFVDAWKEFEVVDGAKRVHRLKE